DLEGWRMLARSYRQLNRNEEWLEALTEVRRLAPDDPTALRDHAYALWLVRTEAGPPDAETVAALEELLAASPRDPVAILGLAEVAQVEGDDERAATLLTRLAEDEEAPPMLREEAARQLEALA